MGFFTSEYPFKIDRKGRLSVPAEFRTVLAQQSSPGLVLMPAFGELALDGCGVDRLQALSEAIDDPEVYETDEEREEAELLFGLSKQLQFDSEGRILLPEEMRAHAGLSDAVVYVGHGPTFRIWNPEAFKAHKARIMERSARAGRTPALRLTGRRRKRESET